VFNTVVSSLEFAVFPAHFVLPGIPAVAGCHVVSREYRFAVCFCDVCFLSMCPGFGLGLSAAVNSTVTN
jgi:hypothetical protein